MSAWIGQARTSLPRIAESALERARLTVVPRQAPPARRTPFVILVAAVLLAGVIGLLLFNTSMQQASFRATALEEHAAVLNAKEQHLRMQLDELRDPQRVAAQAQQMGMVPMLTPAFLRLPDGKVLGEETPATGLDRMRLRQLPPKVPAQYNPRPEVVLAPVEDGQQQVSVDGGAPSTLQGNSQAPSDNR